MAEDQIEQTAAATAAVSTIVPLPDGPVQTTIPVMVTGYDPASGTFVGEYRDSAPWKEPIWPTMGLSLLRAEDMPGVEPWPILPNPTPTDPEPTE